MVENILSIDVEEVFHGEYTRQNKEQNPTYRTPHNIPKILEMLKDHDVKATFFIVGEIAEKYPVVIEMIKEEGHEVAFHGWTHEPLWKLTPERFREEVKAFKKLCPGCMGFRAPSFSLSNKTKWALKILQEEGFKYDSSIFPTWTPLYGIYGAPLKPYKPCIDNLLRENGENKIDLYEFPLTIYNFLGLRLPTAGGFWLRLWNIGLVKRSIEKVNNNGHPAILYIHNWELDSEVPKLKLNFYKSFITYHNLNKVIDKFQELLANYSFTSFSEYFSEYIRCL